MVGFIRAGILLQIARPVHGVQRRKTTFISAESSASVSDVTASGHRTQMQGQFQIKNVYSQDEDQSNRKGCDTPKALSSLIMVEESAAMKINKQKPLHSRRKAKGY